MFVAVNTSAVNGCGSGVVGVVVCNGLDALPHTHGVRVGEVTLCLGFVGVLCLFDAPPQVIPGCAVGLYIP